MAVLLVLVLCAAAGAAPGEQPWKFRSDLANTGVYDDGGTRPDGTLLWTALNGSDVRTCPAVVDGVVYVGTRDHTLSALDAGTGEILWNVTLEWGIDSSPAVAGGLVYAGSWDASVYAFNASDGSQVWKYTTGEGVISSPAVAGGLVYIGSHDGTVYALDAGTGEPAWTFATNSPRIVASSPAVAGGAVFIGTYSGDIYALDARTGEVLWNYTAHWSVHSSPAVADGVVYVGSDDSNLYALSASDGALLWNFTAGGPVRSSPAVADGVVYVGSYDGRLYALDARSGDVIWSYRAGSEIYASPAVAHGVVYAGSLGPRNNFFALDASTGDLLWDYTFGDHPVWASPAVAGGMVFIGCEGGGISAFGKTPDIVPAFDDFDDNALNSTLWDILEYGGPSVNETDQQLEITIPPDSSADTFFAGLASRYALRGDFDIQVDYHLITWPRNSGVRAGLWIERSPTTFTVERVSYSSADYFTPGDHYTTNFADSILVSVTNDTEGKLRMVRTGTTISGYYFDERADKWVLLQSVPGSAVSDRDVTFRIRAWGHDYSFSEEIVRVAFDNLVISKGELIPQGPPTGVTDLRNATYQPTQIRWTWNDPGSIDFSHVMVYLDGVFQKNVTAGTEAWTAKGLARSTAYTIGTRTIGRGNLVSETWVNHTAITSSLSISHLDPSMVIAGSPGFTLNISGTGYRESCLVLWNGNEQPTQFLDAAHLSFEVPAGMVQMPGLVNITVHDTVTGEFSNPLFLSIREPISGAHAWKFRSDLSNSGVYDDGGRRPGNELLWKYMTESYYGSSPSVVDGVVYICGIYDTNAIDAFTGELLWTSPAGGGWASPAVAGNVVYVGSTDRNVSALDASTGALLWQYPTRGVVYSSPAFYNGVVYAGSGDHNLYALDASTGNLLWNYPTSAEVRSGPAVAYGIVYFGSMDRTVYALDASTGALRWNYTAGGEFLYSSPAVANGVVYIQSNDGNLYALDAMTGAHLWDFPVSGWGDSCPAVTEGVVYIGSDDGSLYALDAGTGDLLWRYATGSLVRSSPSVANGIVYFGNNGGNLYALDAGTGDLIWKYATDESGFTNPAIAHGVVYAQGYSGYLYALATLPDDPPASVTDLHATNLNGAEVTWAWKDPGTLGFSHVMVYLDGAFRENVSAGKETWTATGLSPSTSHTIGIRTVGKKGAINSTLVADTVTTGTLSVSHLDPAGVVEDDPAFTLNVYGTGYTPSCTILWNGEEHAIHYLQPDHISMQVPSEWVAHSRRVNIAVHDQASNASSNAVILYVTDNPATAKARKFRSDLNNSGVYDDGGRRPVPTLLWTFQTGAAVTSSPSVVDGVVYIGSQDRNLYALDAKTGSLLWKYDTMERNDYVSSSPAVSNGVVYIGGLKTKIHAIDAYSGALLWKYKLPIRTTVRSSVSSSAAVADGVVYIGNMDGNLYAFSEETGNLLWKYQFPASEYGERSIFSSPAVSHGVVFIEDYFGNLVALDASTGALLWNTTSGSSRYTYSSPSVVNGTVFFGGGSDNTLHAVDALTGDFLWDYTAGGSVSYSPAVANGVVYFGSVDNTTYALNASNGALLWNFTTGSRIYSSPAVANGVVYFGSYDNNTYALDASTGAPLWTFNIGGRGISSPAVVNGVVYIGSGDGNVYAIGTLPLEPPVADFSANTTSGKAPLDVLFTDTSTGIVTWRFWDFGDGTITWANGTQSVVHTYAFPGEFSVSLTAGNVDGHDTVVKRGYIQVSPSGTKPVAWFTVSPMVGYRPLQVRFTDRSMGTPTAWRWDFGDGSTSAEKNPHHTYAAAGTFRVTLTASNAGGNSSSSSTVWVRERAPFPTITPTPTLTPFPTISPKPTIPPQPGAPPISFFKMSTGIGRAPLTVTFTDLSFNAPMSWSWDFGDGNTSTLKDPVHTFATPGFYTVSLRVENAYGNSTTSRNVYVR